MDAVTLPGDNYAPTSYPLFTSHTIYSSVTTNKKIHVNIKYYHVFWGGIMGGVWIY
jgi:hypothetical protein